MTKFLRRIDWYDVGVVGSLCGLSRGLYLAWEPLGWIVPCGIVLYVSIACKLADLRRKGGVE